MRLLEQIPASTSQRWFVFPPLDASLTSPSLFLSFSFSLSLLLLLSFSPFLFPFLFFSFSLSLLFFFPFSSSPSLFFSIPYYSMSLFSEFSVSSFSSSYPHPHTLISIPSSSYPHLHTRSLSLSLYFLSLDVSLHPQKNSCSNQYVFFKCSNAFHFLLFHFFLSSTSHLIIHHTTPTMQTNGALLKHTNMLVHRNGIFNDGI